MPRSSVDLTQSGREQAGFIIVRLAAKTRGKGRFILCPYMVWDSLFSRCVFGCVFFFPLSPWDFSLPGFSSCCLCCAPLLQRQAVRALSTEPCHCLWHSQGAEGQPKSLGGCWAGGFLSGALKLLHLHALPARHRNDSAWASPPRGGWWAGGWVR